ncbi:putative helicase [Phytophthora cactorum]|uniref:Putative helicase n=1 Tax=Phytophthora cactorum TaxID=29920 RepID=A0A8T1D606_9STRA|nr:putative helicase [Phytophthora cactorum]KAG2933974.1 putative helicase [Phytophthora cactorum]
MSAQATRLESLFLLVRDGSSAQIRENAAEKLGDVAARSPEVCASILQQLRPLIVDSEWEIRVAASKCLDVVARSLRHEDDNVADLFALVSLGTHEASSAALNLQTVDINKVVQEGAPLLRSGGEEYQYMTNLTEQERRVHAVKQRRLLLRRLSGAGEPIWKTREDSLTKQLLPRLNRDHAQEIADDIEASEEQPHAEEEGVTATNRRQASEMLSIPARSKRRSVNDGAADSGVKRLKPDHRGDSKDVVMKSEGENGQIDEFQTQTKAAIVAGLVSDLFESMFDSKWEVRHGALLSLRQILLSAHFTAAVEAVRPVADENMQRSFVDKWLEECLIRCICVLALDQFVDYSADGSVSPLIQLVRDGLCSSSGERQCGVLLALPKWGYYEKQLNVGTPQEQSRRIQHLQDSTGFFLGPFAENQWRTVQPDAASEEEPLFYSEQLGSLRRVLQMEACIIDIFSSVGISLQPTERPDSASTADFSRQIAEHIALFPYEKLQGHPKEFEMAHFKRQDLFLVDELVQQSFSRFYHRIEGLGGSAYCEILPVPKKSGFLVKALMNSIKEEEEIAFRTISAQTIAGFVASQAHTQKKCVAKIISNLCNSATALIGVSSDPCDTKHGSNGSQNDTSPAIPPDVLKKTKVRVAGAEAALSELCKRTGDSLFKTCHALEDAISKAWKQQNVDELTIQRCMHLITLVAPHVESDAMVTCLSWLGRLAQLMQQPCEDHQTRRLVAHAVATICKNAEGQHRENAMLVVYNSIFVAFSNTGSAKTEALEAAVMVLDRIVHTLGVDLTPYVPSLVHYAMKTMSSQSKLVRTFAAGAFADLVPLIPLQMDLELRDSTQLLPDSLKTIVKENEVSRSFLESFTAGKAVQYTDVKSWLAPETSLRLYQQHGVDWLCFMAQNNLHGILADDMGLGKTLQTLSAMAAALGMEPKGGATKPCIIVCPPIIVHHWIQEVKKYTPDVFASIVDYSLPASDRKRLRRGNDILMSDRGLTLIVTTYAILRTDIDYLHAVDFSFVVLDEAHLIRNPSTGLFRAVLELHASHRVALSGTPLQNNVADLWALFEFLMPGYLGDFAVFRREFVLPITKSKERNATTKQKEQAAIAIAKLHQKVLPFILRRTKDQVLEELPPKIISNVLLPLSPLQRRLYSLASSTEDEVASSSRVTKKEGKDVDTKSLANVLTNLQLLRKICVHPALVAGDTVTRALNSKEKRALSDWKSSGKMTGLHDLLVECCDIASRDQGTSQGPTSYADDTDFSPHRCLVFAHLQKTLDLTEQMLQDALPGVTYRRLDGRTPHAKRADIVQHFNADPSIDVLLLTTSVGGLGLTLTGADTVIFIEHSWNPFVDLQAMDRAHRIGQKRTVRVFRLIMEESLEEHIVNLQEFKEQVAAMVVQQSDAQSSMNTNTKGVLSLLKTSSSAVAAKELRASVAAKKTGRDDQQAAVALPQGAQELLDQIGELWDESQYESLAFPEAQE